jgi:hypothetical protein
MNYDWALFLHVLGALFLFGTLGAIAVLALAARSVPDQAPLARAAFWTLVLVTFPAWVLTAVFGREAKSAAHWPDGLAFIDRSATIANAGLIVLLVVGALAFRWKRGSNGWPVPTIAVVSILYLVALSVATWMMSTKNPV